MKTTIIEEMNNNLLNYISKNRNQDEVCSFLDSHNLITLYLENLKSSNLRTYNKALALIKDQEDRYSFFLKEIDYIVEQSKISGIDIYFMKGIILADDLFVNPSQRKSMDMDLLVSYDNLEIAHKLLLILGYKPDGDESYTNSIHCVKKYESIREEITHVTSYFKRVIVEDGTEKTLYADLHIKPYHYMPSLNSEKFKEIFSRTKKEYISLMKKEIPTLGTIDTFIHLSAHFMRHYYWEFFKFVRLNQSFVFRIELLNEIALYYNVHKLELDNHTTIDLAVDLNQIEPVYYTMLIINHIHKGCISDEVMCYAKKKFNDYKGLCGVSSKFICGLIDKDFDKQINLQNYELANFIYDSICDSYPVNGISSDKDVMSVEELRTTCFNLNKTELFPQDRNKILSNQNLKEENSTVSYSWSQDSLNIVIKNERSTDPDEIRVSFAKNTSLNCDEEFIEVNGKNYNAYSKTVGISLKDDVITVMFNGKEINKNTIEIKIEENEINFRIPFELLNFRANAGRVINLQTVLFYFVDDEEMKYIADCTRYPYENYMPYEPWICEFKRYILI